MSAELATKRSKLGTLTVLLGFLTAFAPFATDMYLAAFPNMARDLTTDVGNIQLTLSVFFLGMALGQLFYGPLIDRFGRRIPLLGGISLYTLSSFCLIFAPSLPVFLVLRFLQAVGGCAGMIIGRAIIQDKYTLTEAARALSLMMAVQSIGPVAAPVMGGYILNYSDWQTIFILLGIIGSVCLFLTFITLPETLAPEKRQHNSLTEIFSVFKGIVTNRAFLVPALSGAFGGATMFAFISASSSILMGLYHLSETAYGWTFGSFAFGMGLASQGNRLLLTKFDPVLLFKSALVFSSLFSALLLCLLLFQGLPPLPLFILLLFLALVVVPVINANSTALAMAAAGDNSGSASSLVGVIQFGCAGAISAVTGTLHNGTAFPMVAVILCCSLCAFALLQFLKKESAVASLGRA